ncbi:MAG: hypothetical protein HY921_09240 [Elusimicrobia bacterium]|nr:hypothetical protein [Elusimicrobiota bacterium]
MFFLFAFTKIYGLLILTQKLEIASYYASRRWQLESHRNAAYEGFDDGALKSDIKRRVSQYLGYGDSTGSFLGLVGPAVQLDITRTQVWNVVTLTARTRSVDIAWMYHAPEFKFEVTKYVPNRDRPIAFVLPGLQ